MDLHDAGAGGGAIALLLVAADKLWDVLRDKGAKVEVQQSDREKAQDERVAGLERKIDALGDRVVSSFDKLTDKVGDLQRDLGGSVAQLKADVAVAQAQLRTLEIEVGKLRDDRHELSNQVQTLILQRKAAP